MKSINEIYINIMCVSRLIMHDRNCDHRKNVKEPSCFFFHFNLRRLPHLNNQLKNNISSTANRCQ
jgi:hypothetical protein